MRCSVAMVFIDGLSKDESSYRRSKSLTTSRPRANGNAKLGQTKSGYMGGGLQRQDQRKGKGDGGRGGDSSAFFRQERGAQATAVVREAS